MTTHKLLAITACLLIVMSSTDGLAQVRIGNPVSAGAVIVTDPRQQALESAEDIEVMGIIIHAAVQQLYPPSTGQRLSATLPRRASVYSRTASVYSRSSRQRMSAAAVKSGAGEEGMSGGGAMPGMGSAMRGSSAGRGGLPLRATPITKTRERAVGLPLGLYLDGHGVVFQFEAPPVSRPAKPTAKPPKVVCPFMSRPVWERTRMQLRGEVKKLDCQNCHATLKGIEDPNTGASWSLRWLDFYMGSEKPGLDPHAGTFRFYPLIGPARLVGDTLVLQPTAPTKDQLVDRLLKVLAENGHHFRHLGRDERLTVAVTFRTTASSNTGKRETSHYLYRNQGSGQFVDVTKSAGFGQGVTFADFDNDGKLDIFVTNPQLFGKKTKGKKTKATDELSGDLLVRQGDYKKAVEAYEKILRESVGIEPDQLLQHFMSSDGTLKMLQYFMVSEGTLKMYLTHTDGPLLQNQSLKRLKREEYPLAERLYQKLLQAHAAAGHLDKARAALTNLDRLKWVQEEGTPTKRMPKAKQPEKTSDPLPARLVVSVTKAQITALAAGKISPADFRKQARVQYADPAAIRVKPVTEEKTVKFVVEIKGVILSRDGQSVEISIGSDDGLRRNHRLDILKDGKTVGEIEIVRVEPDRALARVISGEAKKGDVVRTTVK
jgi:tetratricopeptide (TPR) repeat protein